ncbi:MAG: hypothetical protein MJB14_17110 [Spirochaetes bacterium]|nr:hypothetical protein [Spirochaetota bacterium]
MKFFFSLIIILLFSSGVFSQETVLLNDPNTIYVVNDKLEVYIDKTGKQSINQINDQDFIKRKGNISNFGFSKKTYWFRFQIINVSEGHYNWLLELSYQFLDQIALYQEQKGSKILLYKTGRNYPFKIRPIKNRYFLFPLKAEKMLKETYYLKVQTTSNLTIPLKIFEQKNYLKLDHQQQITNGIFLGIMIFMSLFNFFLYFFLKERVYLDYAFMIALYSIFQMILDGLAYEFLWPNLVWWNQKSIIFVACLLAILIMNMAISFLNIKTYLFPFYKIFSVFKILYLFIFLSSFFLSYELVLKSILPLGILTTSSIFFVAFFAIRLKIPSTYYYLFAWILFLLGLIIMSLRMYGILPHHFLAVNSVKLGFLLLVLLLAIGLANKIRIVSVENRLVQQKIIRQQQEILEHEKQLKESFFRFVPFDFLRILSKENIFEIELGNNVQKEMVILFSDICDFTNFSEELSPRENFNFLNSYLSRLGPIIRKHKGFIDKYMGDCIMALFEGSVDEAIQSAIDMQKEVNLYNQQRKSLNYRPISIGIGIHIGSMILGTIGEHNRLDTTVISDAVNVAARIERLTKFYNVRTILSESILNLSSKKENYHYRKLDIVQVKGKRSTITVYELLDGLSDKDFQLKMSTKEKFELAITEYSQKNFTKAGELFRKILAINHIDKAAFHYLKNCESYLDYGLPDGWDGVTHFDIK